MSSKKIEEEKLNREEKEVLTIYDRVRRSEEVKEYYRKGNEILETMGYTDHSVKHAAVVAEKAAKILSWFDCSDHEIMLARTAGYLHDIGNAINRSHHAEYGALLARSILKEMDVPLADCVAITAAIANHDETTGNAYDPISAALIIADKTDVRRNRVRNKDHSQFDIHDRVNYAVTGARLRYSESKKVISLNLEIDEKICSMYDYFEIFLNRMVMCRRSAEVLGVKFKLIANGQKVL